MDRLLIVLLSSLVLLSCAFSTDEKAQDALPDDVRFVQKCGECDKSRCPEVRYCVEVVVKDNCACCNVCSTDLYRPHTGYKSAHKTGSPCDVVTCPKYKICMENMQGLPLCTCPSVYSCRRRRKEICGTDGVTYHSRCHMRIAACNLDKRLKVRRREACSKDEEGDDSIKLKDDGSLVETPKSRRRDRKKERRRKRKLEKAANKKAKLSREPNVDRNNGGDKEKKKSRRQKRRKRNKRRQRMQYKSRRTSKKYKFLPYRF